ncbi:MAG: hypothetical protein LBR74_08175 [Eubacterium sp.]|jgi:hypothetical protein|nr:hypothetical protein [Eubacterium sp.]
MKKFIFLVLCAALFTGCFNNDIPVIGGSSGEKLKPFDTTSRYDQTTPETLSYYAANASPEFLKRLSELEPYQTRSEIKSRYYPETNYELIPSDDYGKLYPYPAYNSGYAVIYGLMTSDGRIVVDGAYGIVKYIDWGEGYYILGTSSGGRIITANGSLQTGVFPGNLKYIGKDRVRVLEYRDNGGESLEEFVGEIDLNGNIIAPIVSIKDNYKKYYISPDAGIFYKNLKGGADLNDTPDIYEKVEVDPEGQLKAYIKYTPERGRLNIDEGIICELKDGVFVENLGYDDDYKSANTVIYDSSGKVLLNCDRVSIHGKLLMSFDKNGYSKIYDFDLNEIEEYASFDYIGGNLYVFENENACYVSDLISGKRVEVDFESRYNVIFISPETFICGSKIYDMDGNSRQLFPEGSMPYINDKGLIDVRFYGEMGIKNGLYTLSGEEIFPIRYEVLSSLTDGLYLAEIDNYIGVIRENGEWIIKIDALGGKD